MLAVAAAVGSALLYALASVLQHRAARREPAEQSLRLGLIISLVRRPLWLAGIVADAGGFALQFAALAAGAIVVVQPLQVLGLPFALAISAWAFGHRSRLADHAAAVAVCAGLALFLVVADPAPGRSFVRSGIWIAMLASAVGVGGALALAGRVAGARLKPVLLGAGAGVLYGVAAGLIKTTGQELARGGLNVFTHWQVYVLVAVGAAGMLIGQSAFQAGNLGLSLPAMTVVDPVVSIVIGAIAFHETIAGAPAAVAGEVAGLLLTAAGAIALARSPAIRAARN